MTKAVSLHSFEMVTPRYSCAQNELVDQMFHKHELALKGSGETDWNRTLESLQRFAVRPPQINCRFFEAVPEEIYNITPGRISGADIAERHDHFRRRAIEIFEELYGGIPPPDHLIHVTCTGYLAPSAPQTHFSDKLRSPDITHAYHMGCYAALPAVRIAASFARDCYHTVDIVHTEICSLHFDPAQHSPDQVVMESLFADGHMKYCVGQHVLGRQLEVECVKEKLIPHSQNDMTWAPAPTCMRMTLSRDVPEKIQANVYRFLTDMAGDVGLTPEELAESSLFAIHPGGPKIIERIETALHLKQYQTISCRKVLRERGNMSSATLPHVWKDILESDYEGRVISLAFGPGLTMFGSLFRAHS